MICENCGKEHDGSYGSGRFCCKTCARSFSTKNKKKTKLIICESCGKEIKVPINSPSKKCFDCKIKEETYFTNSLKCPICGRIRDINKHCNNSFCNNHSHQQFRSLIKYFGFDKTKLGTIDVENEYNRIRNILFDLYWNQNLSGSDIAKIYNYNNEPNLISQIFNNLNIPKRNHHTALINAIELGKLNINNVHKSYKDEWHNTWEGKEVYLRSSYESDYANKLDEQKIKYEVESLRIKYFNSKLNEYHCAIPDFYLPETNTIVEIKSNWTLDIQEMKDKVKAYKELGYNFKLILEHKEIDINLL